MPSINISRLKIQAYNLACLFDQPAAFLDLLGETLRSYTNRTKRPSPASLRTSLPVLQTPRAVLLQLRLELSPLVAERPDQAIPIIKGLWQAGYLETRLLAASLLGHVPPESALALLSDIPSWLHESKDKEVQQIILTEALAGIRRTNREAFLSLIEIWLLDRDARVQTWGLRAMLPLLGEPGFVNLPKVFRLLGPTVENVSSTIQLDLAACLGALELLSPTETSQFLQNILMQSRDPQVFRIFRRMQPLLSKQLQEDLRGCLKIQ